MTPLAALLITGLTFGLLSGVQEAGRVGALPAWYWAALGLAALPPVAFHLVTRAPTLAAWGFPGLVPLMLVTYLWFDLPAQVLKVQALTLSNDPGDAAALSRLAWTEAVKVVVVSAVAAAWTLRQWKVR